MIIDHIVISVKNIKRSITFYSSFLGRPTLHSWGANWVIGGTKFFLAVPYKKSARAFDKHNLGLNHLAFKMKSLAELKKYERALIKAKIKNSGVQIDAYGKKKFIWFDDPDGMRLEFYLR